MKALQIILAAVFLVAPTGGTIAQQPQPVFVPPGSAVPPAVTAPPAPYLQSAPVIQPPPQVVPVYPPQSTVVPLPSQTPGSIFAAPSMTPTYAAPPQAGAPEQLPPPPGFAPSTIPGAPPVVIPGAAPIVVGPGAPGSVPVAAPPPPSTITVPVMDDDVAWDQISDVVSDYFRISREQRARRGPDGWAEGCIQTVPQDGATVLEPHRMDSVGRFNLWESTFQSIRRRATVRVVPDANGYIVEVIVEKELEDLPKPEKATAGAAAFRYDQSLPSQRMEEVSRTRQSMRWISLGRDTALEQRMLADIHARLNGLSYQGSVFGR
jgi:hypothetical protein